MTNHELAIARYLAVRAYMDEYYEDSTYENTDDFKSFAKRVGKTAAAIGGTVAVASGGGINHSQGGQAAGNVADIAANVVQQRKRVKKATTFKSSIKTTGNTNKPFPAGQRRPISTLMPGWG